MTAAGSSETLVPLYQNKENQIPENRILHLNPIYFLNANAPKIHFNIILLSMPRLSIIFVTKTFKVFLASSILETHYIIVQKYKLLAPNTMIQIF
jgi:hypothetical protein